MAVRPSSSFVSVTHDASRELRADREADASCMREESGSFKQP